MPINSPPEDLPALLSVARGMQLADRVLRNCRIVNVFSGQIERGDIAIHADRIAGIGNGYDGREVVDLEGAYVAPGLIDAHVHIESSLCVPAHFASAVVPRGVTTVVADPHEIANVCGVAGVRFMADAARPLPLRVVLMAPSCVPATDMATGGAVLGTDDLMSLLIDGTVHGLAEMMNFPGVIGGAEHVLAKLRRFEGRPVDGHAPGVLGRSLCAYAAAGIGSDHECTSVHEAQEKLARGLYVLIREATNAHNLRPLLPLVTAANSRRICFCTDDRQPADLLGAGGIDHMVREAIRSGVDPIEAIRMATLNPCEWFGLRDRGAVVPGKLADIVVLDDLRSFDAQRVYAAGKLVAEGGSLVADCPPIAIPDSLTQRPSIDWDGIDLRIQARGKRIRVVGCVENQLVTEHRLLDASVDTGGWAIPDIDRDLLAVAVIGRHPGARGTGLGFLQGIGLKRGAIAGTVAHDHHNLIVIGCDHESMLTAARATTGAGLAVAEGPRVIATLPLPVAGLMSDQPINVVNDAYGKLLAAARSLGSTMHDPFMAMSFMALEVIPSLKLTDQGLVDVDAFRFVDLFV